MVPDNPIQQPTDLENRIFELGQSILKEQKSNLFQILNKNQWNDFFLKWSLKYPELKTELFRLVDVFPALQNTQQVAKHISEYLLSHGGEMPGWMKSGLHIGTSNPVTAFITSKLMHKNISSMANFFICGEDAGKAHKNLEALWREGFAFTADILGEAAVSETEADHYKERYTDLIYGLSQKTQSWPEQKQLTESTWGELPRVNVSVKCSSLYSQIRNIAFEESVECIAKRLQPILKAAKDTQSFVYLDMEQNDYRGIIFAVAQKLFCSEEFKDYPHLGIVVQAYLKDAQNDIQTVISMAQTRNCPLHVRLVKGAYWDFEVHMAKQRGWEIPVFVNKEDTDAHYEVCSQMLIDANEHIAPAFASHNVRNLSHALCYAKDKGLDKSALEIQMLYGMSQSFKYNIRDLGYRVREYTPVGELLPGMSYLVRRLLENSSNQGFLHAKFFDGVDEKDLLKKPQKLVNASESPETSTGFLNEPLRDFSKQTLRQAVLAELEHTLKTQTLEVPAIIGGKRLKHTEFHAPLNPNNKNQSICRFGLSQASDVDSAIQLCQQGFVSWSQRSIQERAQVLQKTADLLTEYKDKFTALICVEVGKPLTEADADVAEAIDFCRYYVHKALELFKETVTEPLLSETNTTTYRAKGIAAVIAPWNFPLAILCGMAVAPLVCGNPVILKPAEQSTRVGYEFYRLLIKAGVPENVLHFLPGMGEDVGAALTRHKDVHIINFTGSRAVGLQILKDAAHIQPTQRHIKKVIAEMGGKNALIIDDDADLDEAVTGCIQSAFGFAGQKCSAASRILVLESVYDSFKKRFSEAVSSLTIAPSTDPKCQVGPVIDQEAYERLHKILSKHKDHILSQLAVPKNLIDQGFFIPPTVFECADPSSELGQVEFFGPLVTLFKVPSLEHALEIFNDVDYALTGGLYSRSPQNIHKVRQEALVGNLYINRNITGALVARQPFGGFKLSGVGGKAGGENYLLNFVEPQTLTENTLRRGFAPESS